MKIHIFGSSGSGTSTLGKLLATHYNFTFFDADDYYWQKSEIPFTVKNSIEERYKLLLSDMNQLNSWILSGSMDSWCEPFLPLFDAVIFVSADSPLRVDRLRKRELLHFGNRIQKGGDMYDEHEFFIHWAQQYESGHITGRSHPRHEEWIKQLSCPIMRVENNKSIEICCKNVIIWLDTNLSCSLRLHKINDNK